MGTVIVVSPDFANKSISGQIVMDLEPDGTTTADRKKLKISATQMTKLTGTGVGHRLVIYCHGESNASKKGTHFVFTDGKDDAHAEAVITKATIQELIEKVNPVSVFFAVCRGGAGPKSPAREVMSDVNATRAKALPAYAATEKLAASRVGVVLIPLFVGGGGPELLKSAIASDGLVKIS